MGWFRKVTGQQGQINRQRDALAQQEAAAREAAAKQTAAMQESARAAAQAVVTQQERQAASAAASDMLSKPMAEADVSVGEGDTSRPGKFRQRLAGTVNRIYNSGVSI